MKKIIGVALILVVVLFALPFVVLAHVTVLTVSPLLCAGWLVLLEPVSVPQPLNSPIQSASARARESAFFMLAFLLF